MVRRDEDHHPEVERLDGGQRGNGRRLRERAVPLDEHMHRRRRDTGARRATLDPVDFRATSDTPADLGNVVRPTRAPASLIMNDAVRSGRCGHATDARHDPWLKRVFGLWSRQ